MISCLVKGQKGTRKRTITTFFSILRINIQFQPKIIFCPSFSKEKERGKKKERKKEGCESRHLKEQESQKGVEGGREKKRKEEEEIEKKEVPHRFTQGNTTKQNDA